MVLQTRRILTHDSAPYPLRVRNGFKLETVFKARDAMSIGSRTTSNDQFIVSEYNA